ncbi:MAG: hypothetical protein JJU05_02805 [Verrucomicrobia bacterium]|nr:hypothetical protein [Verrucomicrobiota bacterium]MCH8527674.1 hypothetical protein [Kiritimatiellia bacterium]
MKSRNDWRNEIRALPVFDTHTHMNKPAVPVAAQDLWNIVEYFWFRQELQSVGYLKGFAADLGETERMAAFADCFARARNTTWAQMIQETFRTLYNLELSDVASLQKANEAVKASAQDPGWPMKVADKLQIKRIVTNIERDVNFPGMPGVGASLPLWNGYGPWVKTLTEAEDPRAAGEEARAAVRADIAGIASRGYRGMRVHTYAFERGSQAEILHHITEGHTLSKEPVTELEAHAFLAHAIFEALSGQDGMFAQLFLGINHLPGSRVMMGTGSSLMVPNLYSLFKRYDCDFELIAGAPRLNMDVAQVARLFHNVYAGGLWWYNFRPSTYRAAMQARLEAVPAEKCTLLASDGRCIEWCYAKTLLVKNLLADFLHEQVADDHINEADALWVAREWLHDSAARRYV